MYEMSQKVQKLAFFNDMSKKIIGMKEKFVQNREVPVSLMDFLLQTQESFGGFFCLKFYILLFFRGIGLSKLFLDF